MSKIFVLVAFTFAKTGSDNGLYFKDSVGDIRKVTGTHYGVTAPNASPAGQTGNSVGETWVNSSTSAYYLSVWTGASWQKVGAAFADVAAIASVTIASGALVANSALVASGSFGAILASGSLGSVLSSGSLGSVLSSGSLGSILSSGVVTAVDTPVANIVTGALPSPGVSGTLIYKNDSPSGLYVSVNGGWALT